MADTIQCRQIQNYLHCLLIFSVYKLCKKNFFDRITSKMNLEGIIKTTLSFKSHIPEKIKMGIRYLSP